MYETNAVRNYDSQNVSSAEVRTSEVQSEVNRLEEVSNYLDKGLSELENKLNPVLAQHKVAGAEAQNVPTPLRVPLAETLHMRGNHLEGMRERVASMISRLEL